MSPPQHQDRVLRAVPGPIEVDGVLRGKAANLLLPADDGNAVGMVAEEGGHHRLAQQGLRPVVDPRATLLQHHLQLRHDFRFLEREVQHAVRFEIQDGLQMLLRQGLPIAGVVLVGEGVLPPTHGGHHVGVGPGRVLLGALEQQVLQEVRQARLARHLVGGADLVHQELGYRRHAPVCGHHDGEAIGERELFGREDVGEGAAPADERQPG